MSSQVSTRSETLPIRAPCQSSLAVVWPHAKKNHPFSRQESNDFSARIQEPDKTTELLLGREQKKRCRWWVPTSCPGIPRHSLHPSQKSPHRLALLSGALTVQDPGPGCPPSSKYGRRRSGKEEETPVQPTQFSSKLQASAAWRGRVCNTVKGTRNSFPVREYFQISCTQGGH